MSVYCKRIAHWKYWPLCSPDRKTKWPSSSAPVLRNSVRRSSLIFSSSAAALSDFSIFKFDGQRPPLQQCSAGSVIRGSLGVIDSSNNFHFNICLLRQRCHLHSRTSGRILFEIRGIDFVHGLEIRDVSKENGCFDHVIERKPFSSQKAREVVQPPPGLRPDVAGNNLARFRVQRDLTAAKDEVSAAHSLRVRPDRSRRFLRGNDLLHVSDCNCKSNRHNEWPSSIERPHARELFSELKVGCWMLSVERFLLK